MTITVRISAEAPSDKKVRVTTFDVASSGGGANPNRGADEPGRSYQDQQARADQQGEVHDIANGENVNVTLHSGRYCKVEEVDATTG